MNRPIHVCIFTTAHPYNDVRVCQKIGLSLLKAGFRVSWVGPDLAYLRHRTALPAGVEHHLYPYRPGLKGRLRNLPKAHSWGRRLDGVDVFYAPDPDAATLAIRLAKRRRARLVFDIHEHFHLQERLGSRVPRRLLRLASALVVRHIRWICRQTDLVMGVTEGVCAPYREACSDMLVVRNCAPAWFADGPPADVCSAGRTGLTVLHGKASLTHGTRRVLHGLSRAAGSIKGIKVVLFDVFDAGGGGWKRGDFEELVGQLHIRDCVDLRPTVPQIEMPGILRQCDVGMIAWGRELSAGTSPNRLFEYMAAGLPILAPNYDQSISSIVQAEKCGVLVDFEDPDAIGDALVYLAGHPAECQVMGRRSREAFVERHNLEKELNPLIGRIQAWGQSPPVTGSSRMLRASAS